MNKDKISYIVLVVCITLIVILVLSDKAKQEEKKQRIIECTEKTNDFEFCKYKG